MKAGIHRSGDGYPLDIILEGESEEEDKILVEVYAKQPKFHSIRSTPEAHVQTPFQRKLNTSMTRVNSVPRRTLERRRCMKVVSSWDDFMLGYIVGGYLIGGMVLLVLLLLG